MNELQFDWDEGNWPKCGKYGLSRREIEYVLLHDPLILPDRHPPGPETRFNAVGQNEKDRYVFVVFTFRNKETNWFIRPISARYMHRKEIENYERQEKA
uniref:Uncharacterized protein n=1 Tax=Candidatus Kentrum sp. DK TaxID=2126562 RepID=A0A450SSZ0_9GAMM|nr:MAG: hypothetical protein BECKDK2373B_GA0170837_10643 [Candidatus Kentron sp. DK]